MKKSALLLGFFMFCMLMWESNTVAQNTGKIKPFSYKGTVCFSDGTPVTFDYKGVAERFFKLVNLTNKRDQMSYISQASDSSINVSCFITGKFLLKYRDYEVARFEVKIVNGAAVADLPAKLILPFNYLVTTIPGNPVTVYDMQGKPIENLLADDEGYVFLKEGPEVMHDRIIVCVFKEGLPEMKVFREVKQKSKRYASDRWLRFSSPKGPVHVSSGRHSTQRNNNWVVHNIKDDIFYSVKNFHKNGAIQLWLRVYDKKNRKGWVKKLKPQDMTNPSSVDLYLDENGKVILVLLQKDATSGKNTPRCYAVTADGMLQMSDEIYPYYRFKGHYILGQDWIIPNESNIPLAEGSHYYQLNCTGIENDYAEQEAAWVKAHAGKPATKENEFHFVPHKTAKSANLSFRVIFAPEDENLWRVEGLQGFREFLDPQNNNPDFSNITVKECALSIDGIGPIPHVAIDDPVVDIMENGGPISYRISLIDYRMGITITGDLVNRIEGPYPELHYRYKKLTGKYSSREEAEKYCNKPVQRGRREYRCYETGDLKVCPDKYSYTLKEGQVVIDYNALNCGIVTEEQVVDKGESILVEASAPGYITETRALAKRDMEVSDITLSGKIYDKEGNPIDSAKVKLKGLGKFVFSNKDGEFSLNAKAGGKESFSGTMAITLKPITFEISNEELGIYKDGENFGIVSDGFTTLKLHIKAQGIKPESVVVKPPALGNFTEHSVWKVPLVLNENGEGDMEYVPPVYIKNESLTRHLQIKQNERDQYGLSGRLWAAEVPVEFTYEDEEGNPGRFTMNILVCRPPVMLVHGFTGDETTWEKLAVQLRHDKYDAIIREYYHGTPDESTIQMQSQKLGFYILKLRDAYLKNGILQTRVDIVAHSMGGLISRYYISNMAKYGKKAGIVIPYNVKLSREELAQMRFQKPVKLIDVRKLIMVGTPNHGSSIIDERLGALNALLSDYHQVANEQLRFDSPFLSELNSGENIGRHLDPNVQYALIYGRRRRAILYPFDPVWYPLKTASRALADDDGVVTTKSAKLNGVKDFVFPGDEEASEGYIHSPVLAKICKGDVSITVDQNIFKKIEELLQEDIPRVPLALSYAKIVRATGDASMRYFSTESWKPLSTPVNYFSAVKLRDNWCQIKTGEGEATLGFFLNGHHWGKLDVEPNTIVYYEYASPEFVKVYLQQGKARFRSQKHNGGGFEVVMGDKGEQWYAFNPKAIVRDVNTDFIVEKEKTLDVHSISGKVFLGLPKVKDRKVVEKEISSKYGYILNQNGELQESPLPDSGWWSHIDTAFVKDEVVDTYLPLLSDDMVKITVADKYLPISGSTTMKIHTDISPRDIASYQIKISLDNEKMLPFVKITNPEGAPDNSGNYKTGITIREPSKGDYASLKDIPLEAVFHVRFFLSQTTAVVLEKDINIPVGMTLLYGKTVGPDYKPRKQPLPPELNNLTYQIASEADTSGNFFILFNTTLFDKNIERSKELGDKTRDSFDKNPFDLSLNWPDACTLPLTYKLQDTLKQQLVAGHQVPVRENILVDLLNPQEQEQRVKYLTGIFIDRMPLTPESRQLVLAKLDSLSFSYGAAVQNPVYSDSLGSSNVIYIPASSEQFWSQEFQVGNNPCYVGLMHALGHFLQQTLCFKNRRSYQFLWNKSSGSKYLWTDQTKEPESSLFDNQEFISFSEAGADFFSFLMFKFLETTENEFKDKSVYFRPGYLVQFSDSTLGKTGNSQFPAYDISGPQTKFLVEYYGDTCNSNPAGVYSDFMLVQMLFSHYTLNVEPAATINQWLMAKKASFEKAYVIKTGNPVTLAKAYGLTRDDNYTVLIPAADYANASVMIDEKNISDFRQIPAVYLQGETVIDIIGGKFKLQFPSHGPGFIVETEPGSRIKIGPDNLLEHLDGKLYFRAPIPFKTPLASVIPKSADFIVTIDSKHTFVSVFDGEIEMKSSKDDRIILKGQSTSMNKNGAIRKPGSRKKITEQRPYVKVEYPFVFVTKME